MNQLSMFEQEHTAFGTKEVAVFKGSDYVPELDKERLTNDLVSIYNIMKDGKWHTVEELGDKIGNKNQSSVSAQIRNLRSQLNCEVERRNKDDVRGWSEYRLKEKTLQ